MKATNATTGVPGVPTHAELFHALEIAWGIIANASGGDWSKQSQEWQDAAARWRDEQFHANIKRFGGHAQARAGGSDATCSQCAALRDALCSLREHADEDWIMSFDDGDLNAAEYIDTVLAAKGDGRVGALPAPDEAKRLRDLLERALPVLKHRAVDGSGEAEALVGEVQGVLAGSPAPNRKGDEGGHTILAVACPACSALIDFRTACHVPACERCEALQADVARLRAALEEIAAQGYAGSASAAREALAAPSGVPTNAGAPALKP